MLQNKSKWFSARGTRLKRNDNVETKRLKLMEMFLFIFLLFLFTMKFWNQQVGKQEALIALHKANLGDLSDQHPLKHPICDRLDGADAGRERRAAGSKEFLITVLLAGSDEEQWGTMSQTLTAIFPIYQKQWLDMSRGFRPPDSFSRLTLLASSVSVLNNIFTQSQEGFWQVD